MHEPHPSRAHTRVNPLRFIDVRSVCFSIAAASGLIFRPDAAGQSPATTDPALKIELVAQGLSTNFDSIVSAFCFLDERTALVVNRADGTIRRVDLIDGQVVGPGAVVANLDIVSATPGDNQSEFGVQGLIADPNFAQNGLIYARFDESPVPGSDYPQSSLTPGVAGSSSVIWVFSWNERALAGFPRGAPSTRVIRSSPNVFKFHHGGPLVFLPDGTLLASYGNQRLSFDLGINTAATSNFQDVGVIVRLNVDGSIPSDNPFASAPGVPNNARAWYSYGWRNAFGMAVDPLTGKLWATDNGESIFDELNVVSPGMNGGSLAITGPLGHQRQTVTNPTLQTLPGSFYRDPVFSWYQTCGVTGIAFLAKSALGPGYRDRVIVGEYNWHYLWWMKLNPARDGLSLNHPGLQDRVDDRLSFTTNPVGTEAQELLLAINVGGNFNGVVCMNVGPDGLVYMITANGKMFRLSKKCWADIADDAGNVLPGIGVNGGINEGDYNAFFAADGFFFQAGMGPSGIGESCDIADDAGNSPRQGPNAGVNEGDYNAFFNAFFVPCV